MSMNYKFSTNGVANTGCAELEATPEGFKLISTMIDETTVVANNLLRTILVFGGGRFMLNQVVYDADKELEQLFRSHKVPGKDREALKKDCRQLYEDFSKNNSRSFANLFFEKDRSKKISLGKDKKTKKPINHDFSSLHGHGILPLKVPETIKDTNYKYLISYLARNSIASYFVKLENYLANKKEWEDTIASSTLPKLSRVGEFLDSVTNLGSIKKWTGKKYVGFTLRYKKGTETQMPLRDYLVKTMKEKGKKFVFGTEAQHLYGYEPEFLNNLYANFSDLWFDEDVLGNDEYIDLITGKNIIDSEAKNKGHYHWRKEHINIPLFDSYGKKAPIALGKNLINYTMDFSDPSNIRISMRNPYSESNKDKITFRVLRNGYFINLAKMNCESQDEKVKAAWLENEADGIYRISFSTANNGVVYEGWVKQPSLRMVDGRIKADFPVGEKIVRGGKKIRTDLMKHYSTAIACSANAKEVGLEDQSFNVLAFDAGFNPVASILVAKVTIKNGKSTYKVIDKVRYGECSVKKIDKMMGLIRRTGYLSRLVNETCNYIKSKGTPEEYAFPRTFQMKGKNHSFYHVDILAQLGINYDSYLKEIDGLKYYPMDERPIAIQLARGQNWPTMFNAIKAVRKEMGEIKHWWSVKAIPEFEGSGNGVDFSTYLKVTLVKKFKSLQCKFSSDNDTCRSDEDYRNGLRRKINLGVSSVIMSLARKHDVAFIAKEDLDAAKSAFDDSVSNYTKEIWSTGGFNKVLFDQANKFGFSIVEVDSHLTSQVDHETGMLGYRDPDNKNDLYVMRGKKVEVINSDDNAAVNILERTLKRHADIVEFYAERIGDNLYRVAPVGKRRMGSLFTYLGSKEALFKENSKGELVVHSTKLTNKEKNAPKMKLADKEKSLYIFKNGKRWIFRHKLAEEVKQYKDIKNGTSSNVLVMKPANLQPA